MSPQGSADIRDLFSAALAQSAGLREAFLRDKCGANTELFEEVRHLLELYARVTGATGQALDEEPSVPSGTRFGAYEVVRLLGVGAMGEVYLGRRADGAFRREVAIKIINAQRSATDLVTRFERERGILASLKHPHIATLFDAGRSDDGRLYLVMEHVDGIAITEFCAQRGLPIRDRLRLFLGVCDAVAYAHRGLVVHRDLKPTNILVEASGTPKLLDFGIAKLLTPSGLEATDVTNPLLRRATPAYASPEQLSGERAHTGMDVFSLGVILHELLTGRRPTYVSSEATTVTGHHYCKPSELVDKAAPLTGVQSHEVAGDLDAIVLTALAEDAKRRYRSVDALTADLIAYLNDEPVSARAGTGLYRVGKLVKRHRLLAASIGLGMVAVLTAAVSLWQLWTRSEADRVHAERQLAQVRVLASSLYTVDAALAPVAGATAGRQQLMSALSDYLRKLDADAGGDPRVLLEVAEGYRRLADVQGNPNNSNLGDRAAALGNYQHSLDLLHSIHGPLAAGREWHIASILARIGHGDVLLVENSADRARVEYAQVLEEIEQADQRWPHDSDLRALRAGVYRPLGDIELQGANAVGGQAYFEKALAIDRDLVATAPSPEHTRALALTLTRLGSAREAQGGLAEARAAYVEAERLLRETLGPAGQSASITRDLAIGRGKLGVAMLATDNAAGLAEIRDAVTSLRRLADMDRSDARARRDVLVMLIAYGDAIAPHDPEGARAAYREGRDSAVALADRDPANDQAQHDLRTANARLSNAPVQAVDLQLFVQDGGSDVPFEAGERPLAANSRVKVLARAPAGWNRYIVVFGAEGSPQIFDQNQMVHDHWTLRLNGPPPSETIILLASPRELDADARRRVVDDIAAIPGRRVVDWDSHVLWADHASEQLVSTASARGSVDLDWVKSVNARMQQLHGVRFRGRTFPLGEPTQP